MPKNFSNWRLLTKTFPLKSFTFVAVGWISFSKNFLTFIHVLYFFSMFYAIVWMCLVSWKNIHIYKYYVVSSKSVAKRSFGFQLVGNIFMSCKWITKITEVSTANIVKLNRKRTRPHQVKINRTCILCNKTSKFSNLKIFINSMLLQPHNC